MRLLYAGGLEVFQNHLGEVMLFAVPGFRFCHAVDQFVVFVHGQHAVRRKTFDRKRPGNPDLFLILIGFVVEIFVVGLGRDGGINFLLPSNPLLPEGSDQWPSDLWPVSWTLTRHFPFLQGFRLTTGH